MFLVAEVVAIVERGEDDLMTCNSLRDRLICNQEPLEWLCTGGYIVIVT